MILIRILSVLLLPILVFAVLYRCIIGKEDFSRIIERFGFATIKRPVGDVIWIHAVSVGEAKTALILVKNYFRRFPDLNILITSTTLTSAQIINQEIESYKDRAFHQFLPLDSEICVRKFLNFWHVKFAIFLESEIWPNFLNIMKKKRIPVFLANARISQRSAKRWSFLSKLGIKPFDNFDKIFVQNLKDIKLFNSICNVESLYYGNLKHEAPPLEFKKDVLKDLDHQIGNRKIFLAASTHKNEELAVLEMHKKLKERYPDLLTIIVVRHPSRSAEVQKLIRDVNFVTFEDDVKISGSDEVLLVDKLGVLGLFYKLCDFAFIAGSLAQVGGHNPYEAIRLDCAVISGNNYFNFQETYEGLIAKEACIIVSSKQSLHEKVDGLLSGEIDHKKLASNAHLAIEEDSQVSDKLISQTINYL